MAAKDTFKSPVTSVEKKIIEPKAQTRGPSRQESLKVRGGGRIYKTNVSCDTHRRRRKFVALTCIADFLDAARGGDRVRKKGMITQGNEITREELRQ